MFARLLTLCALGLMLLALPATQAHADPEASIVVDLRTGAVLVEHNSRERLHPASLTKMMTIYVAFDAIKRGEVSLDSVTTVSKHAAAQPPSTLNLKEGQRITVANLIRGSAIRSANDAAMALGEAISGSERAFVQRMNDTAAALGMANTSYRNPHGLTAEGQMTTARDVAVLARHLWADHPEHFGLFSLKEVVVDGQRITSTNHRFLSGYQGATGLKTGYTRAAGYNLAATARRGNVELVTVVLKSASNPERYEHASALLNQGFQIADPTAVAVAMAPTSIPATPLAGRVAPAPAAQDAGPHKELRAALLSPGGTALVSDVVAMHGASVAQSGGVFSLPDNGGFRPLLIASQNSDWGIQIGLYPTRYLAEKTVLETTLANLDRLGGAPHSIVQVGDTWSAAYVQMGKRQAESVCRYLLNTGTGCAIFQYNG
jgi:D-alanyl-D-alanine carboxypeptidase